MARDSPRISGDGEPPSRELKRPRQVTVRRGRSYSVAKNYPQSAEYYAALFCLSMVHCPSLGVAWVGTRRRATQNHEQRVYMLQMDVTFTGCTPLVIHNVRLANPLDSYTRAIKAISSKRSKTEDDHAEMMRLEWEGGLYIDSGPGAFLSRCYSAAALRAGAAMKT